MKRLSLSLRRETLRQLTDLTSVRGGAVAVPVPTATSPCFPPATNTVGGPTQGPKDPIE